MEKVLFNMGLLLAGAAALTSFIGLNISTGGVPADLNPIGAVGLGISSLAFLYASRCVPK